MFLLQTDTASVLHEAIEYIKFLHDQVSVCFINTRLYLFKLDLKFI